MNQGHIPSNSGYTSRNQLTLIYERYSPNKAPYKSRLPPEKLANTVLV